MLFHRYILILGLVAIAKGFIFRNIDDIYVNVHLLVLQKMQEALF